MGDLLLGRRRHDWWLDTAIDGAVGAWFIQINMPWFMHTVPTYRNLHVVYDRPTKFHYQYFSTHPVYWDIIVYVVWDNTSIRRGVDPSVTCGDTVLVRYDVHHTLARAWSMHCAWVYMMSQYFLYAPVMNFWVKITIHLLLVCVSDRGDITVVFSVR